MEEQREGQKSKGQKSKEQRSKEQKKEKQKNGGLAIEGQRIKRQKTEGWKQEELVRLDKLNICLKEKEHRFCAVHEVSFSLYRGKTLGIIGESGCGKTLLCHALLGILENEQWEIGGRIEWAPGFSRRDLGFIAQVPASAFDPRMKLGGHFREMAGVLGLHRKEVLTRAIELLYRTGIQEPKRVLNSYAFELSGGMLQRVMIALALLGKPKLLIADEPTTALDAATQWEILGLLKELKREYGISILMVSHDLKVIEHMAEDICVMYAGYVVEQSEAESVLKAPLHPYTYGLLASRPTYSKTPMQAMEGSPPGIREKILGCPFAMRCKNAEEICQSLCPPLSDNKQRTKRNNREKNHNVRCFRACYGKCAE